MLNNSIPSMDQKPPSIAMIPCPGLSHLIPQLEFAKRLVSLHPQFHVTLLIPTLGSPSPTTHSLLQSLPPQIHSQFLPQIDAHDLPPNVNPATQMHLTVSLSLPSFSDALTDLRSRFDLVALLVDLFSVDALEFAKKLEISSFVFFASSAANLSFLLYLPALDEILSADDGGDLSKPVKLPGSSIAIPAKHLPDMVHDRSTPYYKTMLHLCKGLHKADTILVNTFSELEPEAMKTFAEINPNLPVYSVGPVIQSGSTTRENGPGSECLDWLDKQPRNSVLYVCFGSGGSLSYEQTAELAWGLEMSGERFMWVVRPPSGSSISTYLSADKDRSNDPLKFLPDGFVDRVKDHGFLVQSWCPQIDVLKHEATGGFLTHCGWSSTVESLIYGKPTIAWPLFADQPVNAMMLTDVLKVAVTPKGDKDGIVKREEVSRCVKCVLASEEGKEMYKRVQMIKDAANTALGEKGSSRKNLENVVTEWMKKLRV